MAAHARNSQQDKDSSHHPRFAVKFTPRKRKLQEGYLVRSRGARNLILKSARCRSLSLGVHWLFRRFAGCSARYFRLVSTTYF
ncbi:unnamed protein product [Callosobruchus maculatus]|uniref:Uncharacterized protein n=1 Tax=Callosobruchus maculatus TaxID=64391 RepID=A0A653DP30_CALMS|nr:unnamed protein product [Callosobruchus maculatus]